MWVKIWKPVINIEVSLSCQLILVMLTKVCHVGMDSRIARYERGCRFTLRLIIWQGIDTKLKRYAVESMAYFPVWKMVVAAENDKQNWFELDFSLETAVVLSLAKTRSYSHRPFLYGFRIWIIGSGGHSLLIWARLCWNWWDMTKHFLVCICLK